MTTPNYMGEGLKIPELLKLQLCSQDLETTLVHRLMDKNGWDFPSPEQGQHEDPDGHFLDAPDREQQTEYDMAVEEVKWFIEQLISLS